MKITGSHFGGHMLATKDTPDPGGPVERFDDLTGTTSLRWPGGTVTERIAQEGRLDDLFGDGGEVGSPDRLVTLREAQEFAHERGDTLQVVLPTRIYLREGEPGARGIDEDAMDDLMAHIADALNGVHGPMSIRHFEIGNEWWGTSPDDLGMTASEYGQIANAMTKKLAEVFEKHAETAEEGWEPPLIGVQAGVGWRENSSDDILAELDMDARADIGAIVTHFYPTSLENVPLRQLLFKNANDMRDAEGMDNPDLLISEWNIHNTTDGDKGMEQASALLEAFDMMIDNGVTDANIWGTNYKFLDTRLAEMSHNPWDGVAPEDVKLTLTPTGHVFKIMATELPGTELGDHDVPDVIIEASDPDALRVNSYVSDDKTIIFLSSRSGEPITVRLDMEAMGVDADHVWARMLEARDNPATQRDEGDSTSPHARAQISTYNRDELDAGGEITIPPHGIIQLGITHDADIGVNMEGDFQIIDPDFDFDDVLIGSRGDDLIRGHHGNDQLYGGAGNDILEGGDGNDTLDGGSGHDLLVGGSGNNVLIGGTGNDIIIAGDGSAQIEPGEGASIIFVPEGEADILLEDPQSLIVSGPEAHIVVGGFQPLVSTLHLPGLGGDRDDALEMMSEDGEDLVITMAEGGSVTLEGMAGAQEDVADSLFHLLDPDEQAEKVHAVTDDMTLQQLEAFESHAKDLPGGTDIIENIGDKPEIRDGYGQRVSQNSDGEDDDEGDNEEGDRDDDDTPLPEVPDDQEDKDEEKDQAPDPVGAGSGGGCMIAQGFYGGQPHGDVQALRRYRDKILAQGTIGRGVIRAYWAVSPHLVRRIDANGLSGRLGRALLRGPVLWAQMRTA